MLLVNPSISRLTFQEIHANMNGMPVSTLNMTAEVRC